MDIKLEKAAIEQKSVLRNLLELYNYDFTEFEPDDVDENGLYGYKYLDHYWIEKGRNPFFIRVDGKLAGFVLVREVGISLGNRVYSMAEFFVMKKYRKTGVGRKAANMVFDTLRGEWKVSEIENNIPAQCFWRKVISEYTKGSFEEIREVGWHGPIQRFVNV
jgi:predicted acetyltransferase